MVLLLVVGVQTFLFTIKALFPAQCLLWKGGGVI